MVTLGKTISVTSDPTTADPFTSDPFRVEPASFPKMYRVTQRFDAPTVKDVPGTTRAELERIGLSSRIPRGGRVAITAGSRGVANIAAILRTVAAFVRDSGATPVVLPTMGSHGGATAEGQVEMLASLGVSEASVGCQILATMETVQIGTSPHGVAVHMDKNASECDGIIVVGRVKQHTDFDAPIESGLHKMMVIGLGKHRGAIEAHRKSITIGFPTIIPEVARIVLANTVTPILGGVGIVENAHDQTAVIEAVLPEHFEEREKALLVIAKRLIGKLPFKQIDVLVVDEAGKNISGNGLDTNVTNRVMLPFGTGPGTPKITRVIIRDLTDETHGNAAGLGQADFILKRAADKIDWNPTYTNLLTSLAPEYGRLPVTCRHDHQALSWAVQTTGLSDPSTARIVWIRNTLELGTMYISEPMLEEIGKNPMLSADPTPVALSFDSTGHLPELLRPAVVG